MMFAFLREFTRNPGKAYTIILMDEDQMEVPRRYQLRPRQVLYLGIGAVIGVSLLIVSLITLTPVREFVPGYGTAEIREKAQLHSLRLTALQDSLEMQHQYVQQLRYLVLGQVDSTLVTGISTDTSSSSEAPPFSRTESKPVSEDWADHEQPALPLTRMPVFSSLNSSRITAPERHLTGIRFPVQPPVNGFLTRVYDARTGHFGIDFAIPEGTPVRSIGDGYIILSDWTQEGGYTISVQHVDGYVSIYKHCQQLLKRTGDRVRNRDAIALSGNSGEITTGPHLHFELWYNGLAQDPRSLLTGN